jgi:uncharacterized membrane protein YedE/YeeE
MIGPLVKTGEISQTLNLWLAAFPIGFLFGYALQRSGLTDSRRIAATFYMKNADVPVVMFTAIVFAMLGLWSLSLLGLLDISRVYLVPTFLAPMAVGGLIFGIGMALGGYCPGTSFAAAVTGKLDALVFVGGFLMGTLFFGDLYSLWKDFYDSGASGVLRLDQVFGIGLGPTLLLITLVAVLSTLGMRWLQHRIWHNAESSPSWSVRILVAAALVVAGVLALYPDRDFFAIENTAGSAGGWDRPWEDPYESILVGPLEAGRIVDRYHDRIRCFDLRSRAEYGQEHLRGAVASTPEELEAMTLAPTTVVLAYGSSDDPQVLEVVKALRKRGLRAFAAEGGFEALRPYYVDPLASSLSPEQRSGLVFYRTLLSPQRQEKEAASR